MRIFIREFWLYILILVIVVFSIGSLYVFSFGQQSIISDLSGGLFVEVLGAILTFILIDMVIRKSEKRKRIRMEKAALKSFRFTVLDLLNIFWDMRRAAAKKQLEVPPSNWREALSSDVAIDDIKHLDFLSEAGVYPPCSWNDYVSRSFKDVYLPSIRRLIDSYSPFLSERLIEKLEALNGSELFSRFFLQVGGFSSIPGMPKQVPMLAVAGDCLRSAILNLLDFVDIYNELCPEKSIEFNGLDLSEKNKPLLGTGRVEYLEE